MRANHTELDSARLWGALGVANGVALCHRGNGHCALSHWGYVIRGAMRVTYPDHEEVIGTGDAYYVAPGHLAIGLRDAQVVVFTVTGEVS